jgi:hypothetical protein
MAKVIGIIILILIAIRGILKSTARHKIGYVLIVVWSLPLFFDSFGQKLSAYFENHKLAAEIYQGPLILFLLVYVYDLAPQPTGKKGRPAKHGRRLSTETDFTLSDEKIGDYYIGVRQVLANLFGQRKVLAYVTASDKEKGTRRLFFSTIFFKIPQRKRTGISVCPQ